MQPIKRSYMFITGCDIWFYLGLFTLSESGNESDNFLWCSSIFLWCCCLSLGVSRSLQRNSQSQRPHGSRPVHDFTLPGTIPEIFLSREWDWNCLWGSFQLPAERWMAALWIALLMIKKLWNVTWLNQLSVSEDRLVQWNLCYWATAL